MDYDEIEDALIKSRTQLNEKQEELRQSIAVIETKLTQVETLRRMKAQPMEFVSETLPAVRLFNLFCGADLQNLIHCEKNIIVMVPYDLPQNFHYGLFLQEDAPETKVIRPRDPAPRLYLKVLLQSAYNKIEENNLQIYYDYLNTLGYTPGLTMGKVLVSAYEGKLYNFYEAWIEATPDPCQT